MKKIFGILFVLMLISTQVFGANQWREGTGADSILGTEAGADIDAVSFQNIVDPLDRVLAKHRQGCKIKYLSASTLTVEAGEVVLSNTAGTIRLFQQNTSDTTVGWANIDGGIEGASVQYYIYAYQNAATDADFDIFISTSSTAPTGGTYYRRLGSFYNNADGDIEMISNDDNIGNQSKQVIGSGAATTTSGVYVDMTSMSITMTTGANPCLVLFSTVILNNTVGKKTYIIVDIDGTDKATSERFKNQTNVSYQSPISTSWLEEMTAGSHTFKIQWKVDGGTVSSDGVLRAMQVIELK